MMPATDESIRESMDEPRDLGLLFHRLNNQLGIILANAELLEAKSASLASASSPLPACSTTKPWSVSRSAMASRSAASSSTSSRCFAFSAI